MPLDERGSNRRCIRRSESGLNTRSDSGSNRREIDHRKWGIC